jgi:hypothetical protein
MKYYTSTTQFNCGIDLHARQMYVSVMDRDGKKLVHTNIKNNDFNFFLKLVAPWCKYHNNITTIMSKKNNPVSIKYHPCSRRMAATTNNATPEKVNIKPTAVKFSPVFAKLTISALGTYEAPR